MKRCCFLLTMIYLACGVGFSLFAGGGYSYVSSQEIKIFQSEVIQEYLSKQPDQPDDSLRIEDRNELQAKEAFQDTIRFQNRSASQNKEQPQDKTKVKLTGNQLIIEDLPEDGVLEIYNIMGVKVFNRRIKSGTNQYALSLSKGYYIIKIGKFTRKIAVK